MWPLSWYQFCVSLPLEVRTVGLVLFLQVLTLLSVLHCLPPAGQVEPVFSDSVFIAAVRRNNRELHNTEKKVLFATCATWPVSGNRCRTSPLPLPPADRTSVTSRRETCPESHADREEEGRMNGGRSKWSSVFVIDFHPLLPALAPTPCQHTNSVPPSSPPSDRDDLSASSLSAPLRPPHRQLLHIPLSSSSTENTLIVCLFNARSVGSSRRRSDMSTFIQDNNIDIMLLAETWLRPAGDEAKMADLAPPGYSVLSFPRSAGGSGAKGGGIAFVIRDSLKPHVATTLSFPVQHPCFETTQLTLTYNKQLTNPFCIYRPPPSKKNKISDSMFFDQFFDFLEHSDSLPGKTLLMGDFNFHFENVENNSRKLHDIIDMFNLTQSISEPTQNQGHLLDLVFSKKSDNIWPHSHLVQTWCICTRTKTWNLFVPMPQKDWHRRL